MSPRRRVCSGAAVVAALIAVAACSAGSSSGAAVPHFVDDLAGSGIDHAYTGDGEYFVGGGVGTFDCDDDGRPDLYFAGGASPAALYRNVSDVGGALRFQRVPSPITDLTAVTGAYPIDVDSDGIADLMVLRRGGNVLLHGLGKCAFEAANEQFGLDGGSAWTVGFSATWEAGNSLPTLAFGNYLAPGTYDCDTSRLVRPAASGSTYATPLVLAPGYCSLSMLFTDWNHSGQRDLRVANDRNYYRVGEDQLWKIRPGVAPTSYTEAEGWRPLVVWGMGIASRDLTGDGIPEVFVTSQGDNKLQMLDAGATTPSYHDIALARGVTAQRPYTGGDVLPSTAWHPEFGDVNDDGNVDLFVSKGNVEGEPDYASKDPSNLLVAKADGTFTEGAEAAGIVHFAKSRGAALVDLNMDGMLDLVVVDRAENIQLWRNVGKGTTDKPVAMGHWLSVEVRQPAPNVDAIGAWLEVKIGDRTLTREITIGGGHASGELTWLHTGLGGASQAQVRVQWPDGTTGAWMTVDADQFVTITRGVAAPVPWTGLQH